MRLHGQLLATGRGDGTDAVITAFAKDADNEDRLQEVELRVKGQAITIVPVMTADLEAVTVPEGGEAAGHVDIPIQRNSRLDGNDFS